MNSWIDAAINRSRTTFLILLMILLAGVAARIAIPIEAQPRIEVPFIVVTVPHEGISPEDSERLLVLPLETELRAVEGVKEIRAYAAEGFATITVEFNADFDLDKASIKVRDAVDRAKPKLPSTAEEPIIAEQSTDDWPIIQINLLGHDVPERVLYQSALTLRDNLEGIPEVMQANLSGDREELLEAIIDPTLLESYQISNEQLINTVIRNNRLIAAGAIDTGQGRFSVKVPSVIETASDIFDLPVKISGDTVVTLKDVAHIKRTFKDRTRYARINGNNSISVNVTKRANANLIDTVRKVRQVVAASKAGLPQKMTVYISQDQAPYAERQVTELQGNILTALALVMIVVVAAMGIRSGIIVGVAIPSAFLFALIFIYSIGYTFNTMVMFGMLLGLGMLIDGAIVVTEYADRKMVEGFEPSSAYALAAKRMFWPVTASVGTTLAAFLPLVLWPGIVGKFMRYLPVTVFAVLTGSLLYALFFGPALGAVFGKAGTRDKKSSAILKELEEGDPTKLDNITGIYARLLSKAARHAPVTFGATILVLVGTFALYGAFGNGMIFFNDADAQYAAISVRARGNLSAQEINRLVQDAENEIVKIPGIKDLNTSTRLGGTGGFRGSTSSDTIGRMFVELYPESERNHSSSEIMELIRQRTAHLAGIKVEVKKLEDGPPVGKKIQMQFSSRKHGILEPSLRRVEKYMQTQVKGLRDFDDSLSLPGIEWKLKVDRAQAALFGADVSQVGMAVQLVTNGILVGKYRPDDSEEEVDIRVRYPRGDRGINALDNLRISTTKGLVPISNFVKREAIANVDTIERVDGIRVELLRADTAPGILADNKVKEIKSWLATQNFDPALKITFRGANEEQSDTFAFLGVAFAMALLMMFVLLVTQFNSLYQSVLILFAVVMSTAGVLLGLIVTQQPFSAILTGTGVVALAGIVVNNNIVLIDTYNHLKREHPELDYVSLIVRTGAQRLRPVMLTTVTTIFGLLPMATNWSIDLVNRSMVHAGQVSSVWAPLAQSIVWGLSVATLLTLVATPAMLAIPYQIKTLFNRTESSATLPIEAQPRQHPHTA